ncbi:MAG: polyketide synthase dehydratase domain-containing protein, partial [Pseudomonadota bacterium]
QWPGRVVSINWGPWESSGMVSEGLQKQFARLGVQVIPKITGIQKMLQELSYGEKSDGQIIIGGIEGWEKAQEKPEGQLPSSLPLFTHRSSALRRENGTAELIRSLDPSIDLYLRDHTLDGKPVLPAAMAMELMAEVASTSHPDLTLVRIRDFRVHSGILIQNGAVKIKVLAESHPGSGNDRLSKVSITPDGASKKTHYAAVVEFSGGTPGPKPPVWEELHAEQRFPLSLDEAYEKLLFHGPLLQNIKEICGVGSEGIRAWLTPSFPSDCLAAAAHSTWLIDPVIVDCAFQLIILWTRVQRNMTALPSCFKTYTRLGSLSGEKIDCQIRIAPESGQNSIRSTIAFLNESGQLLGIMEGVESTCSSSLNRLSGEQDLQFSTAGKK